MFTRVALFGKDQIIVRILNLVTFMNSCYSTLTTAAQTTEIRSKKMIQIGGRT